MAGWAIERLTPEHDRSQFECGSEPLDRYLKQQASQDSRRLFAGVFVALEPPENRMVAGFYTLSAFGVAPGVFPDGIARKLPRYSLVPALLLGRLAVHRRHQGKGLGERLLVDALLRSYTQSVSQAAAAFVVVDAKDESAVAFYRRFRFEEFPDPINRLFLPMQTIARLFVES